MNLRYVNRFLWKCKFKYEDMRVALMLIEQGDFLCTFDLKSGYHHVDIHDGSQTYLGFSWERKYYVFTVLPFGLSTACYIFTKLMRPLVRLWRSEGIRAILYIDDGLLMMDGLEQAMTQGSFVRQSLQAAGFVVNQEKSQWKPMKTAKWLGFELNTEIGTIAMPNEKISSLKSYLASARQTDTLPARALAGIIGRLIAMGLGIGQIARLRTRSMYACLNRRVAWCDKLLMDNKTKDEIEFWYQYLPDFNGQAIWRSPSTLRIAFSDASSTGYGGFVVEHGKHIALGQWSHEEQVKSSTWRELVAVQRVLEAVAHKLVATRVKWFTDNQNVARIVVVGSKVAELQVVAVRIFKLMIAHQIVIEPEWIPREENEIADYLSRVIDYDDWSLSPRVFRSIDTHWGPHTVDRFASDHNAQLPRFNSRFWSPGAEAMDAFTIDWSGENNWLCPPISLIPRVLRHAKECRCEGTIVVPVWKSAVFWPMLCPDGTHFAMFVKGAYQLPESAEDFLPGLRGANLFKGYPNTPVMVLRISF